MFLKWPTSKYLLIWNKHHKKHLLILNKYFDVFHYEELQVVL